MNKKNKLGTVFVGLSGGVDSSVSALRLIQTGYTVIGVFIKVWQPDFLQCSWEQERLDAMRVAAHLNIPFRTFDGAAIYKKEVADYMIREYKSGRTPNPDIMCNQHVKFGVFLKYALEEGADFVATGHYAQNISTNMGHELHRGIDNQKDQSYFLWTLTQEQLTHILFPIGNTKKEDIRIEAAQAQLPTAQKKDSQGICFLGYVDIKEFLSHYAKLSDGTVLNIDGETIGVHTGALIYTIGQRHGFSITKKEIASTPHYVIGRDIETNSITVSTHPPKIQNSNVSLTDVNYIPNAPHMLSFKAQFRYRQEPFPVSVINQSTGCAIVKVLSDTEAPSRGQSCVFYKQERCFGGGIIT